MKDDIKWITVNGAHIPLKHGQSESDAIKEFTDEQERKDSLKEKSVDQLKRESMVEIDLDFFSRKKKSYTNAQIDIPEMPKELNGFLEQRKSTAHHISHAKEMGYKNQTAYLNGAINFWKNSKGTFYFSPIEDKFYKYNPTTNEFMAINSEGNVLTYYIYNNQKFQRKAERYGFKEI